MTLEDAKSTLLLQLGSPRCSSDRAVHTAIKSLPDRADMTVLDPLLRSLIDTRIAQLQLLEKPPEGIIPLSKAELQALHDHLDDETEWQTMDEFWDAWSPRKSDRLNRLITTALKVIA